MSTELTMLAWSVVLAIAQIIAAAQVNTARQGFAYGASPRDEPPPRTPSVLGGRLERAAKNMMETFPLAAAAILIAAVLGRSNGYTVWGAQLYFWARLFYVGAYATGIPVVRTLLFLAGNVGFLLVLFGATRS